MSDFSKSLENLKGKMMAATYEWLRSEIQSPTFPRSKVYKLLKEELGKQGYWKNKPRGKPGFRV